MIVTTHHIAAELLRILGGGRLAVLMLYDGVMHEQRLRVFAGDHPTVSVNISADEFDIGAELGMFDAFSERHIKPIADVIVKAALSEQEGEAIMRGVDLPIRATLMHST